MKKRRPKYLTYDQFQKLLLSTPGARKAKEDLQPEFAIIQAMIDARVKKKMSQEQLAKKMGTGQAAVSRLENVNANPSLLLLKRLAHALDLKLEVKFTPR